MKLKFTDDGFTALGFALEVCCCFQQLKHALDS